MADYIACFRTNAFPVRDPARFNAWIKTVWNLDFIDEHVEDGKTTFEVGGYSGIPDMREDDDELVDIDFIAELAGHLPEGAHAIVTEIGHEKLRYLVGISIAVDHRGDRIEVNLDDVSRQLTEAGAA